MWLEAQKLGKERDVGRRLGHLFYHLVLTCLDDFHEGLGFIFSDFLRRKWRSFWDGLKGDPTVLIRLPCENFNDEWGGCNCNFRRGILDDEREQGFLERVCQHIRLLHFIEGDLLCIDHLLDLVPKSLVVVQSMSRNTLVEFTAQILIMHCRVKVGTRAAPVGSYCLPKAADICGKEKLAKVCTACIGVTEQHHPTELVGLGPVVPTEEISKPGLYFAGLEWGRAVEGGGS
ncbi:hypothetical protein CRG98_037736 [Punica granatum]|uniref:Uncharacterized protein n=1 Tax=Punica granatum TaxID=22663 RepID=A0A2I0IET1_PUNGR|nr:hypothetical protein CRG98_037736 [Punica granatum]